MPLARRKALLLAKIETTLGTDAVPVAGTDAVKVEDFTFDPNVNLVQTNEVTPSLDMSAPLVGGMRARLSFSVLLKGPGVAGQAPEWGKLMRACAFEQVITATAVPAAPEACAAGSTTTATLAASAAATANQYRGMPLNITGTPAGANGTYLISDYTAGKVATLASLAGGTIGVGNNYQIPVNVLYRPTSDASVYQSLTFYVFRDGKRIRLTGNRGTVTLSLEAGGIGRLNFEFMGFFVDETDVALPTSPVYDSTLPPIWRNGKMLIGRTAAAVGNFQFGANVTMEMPGNPNLTEGFDYAYNVSRDMGGEMDPLDELVATSDTMSDFRNGTQKLLLAQLGSSAGNRIAVTIPSAQYRSLGDQDRNGLNVRRLGFKANGIDAGGFLAIW